MTTLKKNKGVISNKEAMNLLKAVSQKEHKTESGRLSSTQWSVVYDTKELSATISMGMDYSKTYKISLNDK